MDAPHGQTVFQEGMRVTKEHLDNLQDILQAGILQMRQAAGFGKVVYGLKVDAGEAGSIRIAPGLALDDFGRSVIVPAAQSLTPAFPISGSGAAGTAPVLYLVATHNLVSGLLVKGIPTLLTDGFKIEARTAPPPYADGGVRFAELHPPLSLTPVPGPAPLPPTPPGLDTPSNLSVTSVASVAPAAPAVAASAALSIVQKGDWYSPPLAHGHSGKFFTDAQSNLRFDGQPLGFSGPLYDSSFITLSLGGTVTLKHGLPGRDFLAQLEARRHDGAITNHGTGREYWYDLPADGIAVISRTKHKEYTEFRLRLWPFGSPGTAPQGPVLPVADAGPDAQEELGHSFDLDGSGSRSPIGAALTKFKWIQLS